jgi:hypothetical protein
VLAGQFGHAQPFNEELAIAVLEMRMAGERGTGHGRGAGLAVPVPLLVADEAGGVGFNVWGKVARPAAASPVGRYNGPFWPQPASTATPAMARTSAKHRPLSKIWQTFNIAKL